MLSRIWNSPTLTTWASFFSRTAALAVILPLVLRQFSVAEFTVWSLFAIFSGLQLLFDMGFSVTFVRAIAVALAGASTSKSFLQHAHPTKGMPPNLELVRQVVGVMRFVYRRLAIVYAALLSSAGTLLLVRSIDRVANPQAAWIAWIIVVAVSYVALRASYLGVLLMGLNEVAVVRRWDALMSLGSGLSSALVLLSGGGLLELVVVYQVWGLLGTWRNLWLCRTVHDGRFRALPPVLRDDHILADLWPSTWRSGLGVAMSYGLVQATGIVHSQIAPTAATASYLLCLRILQLVSTFSQAPYYSKLPLLPRLRAEGKTDTLITVAASGMRQSLWAFALAFTGASLLGPPLLHWLDSSVAFPDSVFWVLLGTMFFAERYAAMHLNLYSTTNHIITHIANGVTGLLSIAFIVAALPFLGMLAMPAGLLAGYLTFYSWYPVMYSYREFRMPFLSFEWRTSVGPLICFAAAAAFMLISNP